MSAAVLSPARRSTMSCVGFFATRLEGFCAACGSTSVWATRAEIKLTSLSIGSMDLEGSGGMGLLRSTATLTGSARWVGCAVTCGLTGAVIGVEPNAALIVLLGTWTPASSRFVSGSRWLSFALEVVGLEDFSSTLMMVAAGGAAASTASGTAGAEGAVVAIGGVVAEVYLSTVGAFDPVRLMSPHAAVMATPPSNNQTKLFFPKFEEEF